MTHTFSRRGALALGAGGLAMLAVPARAASVADAVTFVQSVVQELEKLMTSGRSVDAQAADFRAFFARRAASKLAARFVMGVTWRDMSDDQQARMHEAFLDHVARVYSELLGSYNGQTIEVTDGQDFGRKGILVRSIARETGQAPVDVEWLVSDRGGEGLQLIDIIIEGLSMLQSQRQEFATRLEKRGGDVDLLIHDLAAG